LDELLPEVGHLDTRQENNRVEADHGRLTARLRPMRGLRRFRSVQIIGCGHAFVQNIRRGHYDPAIETTGHLRLAAAFIGLAQAV
jgi:transposase-like protein